jgi:hypothetical protein
MYAGVTLFFWCRMRMFLTQRYSPDQLRSGRVCNNCGLFWENGHTEETKKCLYNSTYFERLRCCLCDKAFIDSDNPALSVGNGNVVVMHFKGQCP